MEVIEIMDLIKEEIGMYLSIGTVLVIGYRGKVVIVHWPEMYATRGCLMSLTANSTVDSGTMFIVGD